MSGARAIAVCLVAGVALVGWSDHVQDNYVTECTPGLEQVADEQPALSTEYAARLGEKLRRLGEQDPAETFKTVEDGVVTVAVNLRAVKDGYEGKQSPSVNRYEARAVSMCGAPPVSAPGLVVQASTGGRVSGENGRLDASRLRELQTAPGHRLQPDAAVAFDRMSLAFAAEFGAYIRVTDSYRTYEVQVDLARRKGLYSQGGLAARPGTSNHGWGLATDLNLTGSQVAWMRANAGTYGYKTIPREPWHWEYKGGDVA